MQSKWKNVYNNYLAQRGLKRDDEDEEQTSSASSSSDVANTKTFEAHTDGNLGSGKWREVYRNFLNDANAREYNKRVDRDYQRWLSQKEEEKRFNSLSDEGKLEYYADKAKQKQADFEKNNRIQTSLAGGIKALAPGGVKVKDWYSARKTKNQLQDNVSDAQSALDSYKELKKQEEEENQLRKLDMNKLSAYMEKLEKQKSETYGEAEGALRYIGTALQGDSKGAADVYSENQKNYKKRAEIERKLKLADDVMSQKNADGILKNLTEDELKTIDDYNNAKEFSSNHGIVATYKAEQKLLGLGYDNIYEIADERKKQVNKQRTQELEENSRDFAQNHPKAASAAARVLAPAAAVSGMVGNLEESLSGEKYLDLNNPYYDFTRIKNNLDETVSANMESGGILSRETKAFLYQTAASGVDSITSAAIGGAMGMPVLGEAMLGAGAMNDAVLDVAEKGGTKSQALLTGLTAGVNETLFEHLSLSQLRAFKEVPVSGIKDALKNIGKATVTNFSEEAATEIANIVSDYYINGGISDYVQSVDDYMEKGMSESKAKRMASVDMAERISQAGLGGALMGGVFGAGGSISGKVGYEEQLRKEGKAFAKSDSGAVEKLVAGAYDLEGQDNDISKLRSKVENSKGYQAYLSGLENQTQQSAQEQATDIEDKTDGKKNKKSKKNKKDNQYKQSDYRNIGRLAQKLTERTNEDIEQTVKGAVANRLTALGEEQGTIESLSQTITKTLQGEKLSSKEKTELEQSKFAKRVINEYSAFNREMYSSGWANSADEDANEIYNRRYSPDIEAFRSRQRGATAYGTTAADSNKSISEVVSENKNQYTNYAAALIEPLFEDGQEHSPVAFERSFAQFYEYGKAGFDFEQIKDNEAADLNFSKRAKQEAFKAGVEAQKIGTTENKITGIAAITDGDIIVSDSSGERVSLSQANLSEETMSLYKNAAALKDTEAANTYISGYRKGVSLKSYDKAFSDFYAAGISNKTSFDKFIESNKSYATLFKIVPENVAKAAFDFGGKVVEKNSKAAQTKQTSKKNTQGSYKNQTVSDEVLDSFYEAVAAKTKLNIIKRDAVFSQDGKEANAQFIAKTFSVIVSANAESEFTDMVHELTHATSAFNQKGYAQVAKAVVSWYTKEQGYSNFEERLKEITDAYGDISREEATEELVSEAIAGLFSTDEGVSDFMRWLESDSGYTEPQRKTVLQKVADIFKKIVETIKNLISGGQLSDTAKEFAQMQADRAAEIRQMFLNALDGSQWRMSDGGQIKESKKRARVFFEGNHFPNVKSSGGADANTVSILWAKSEDTLTGDRKLISYKDKWYVIEKFDDMRFNYQIMEEIRSTDYERRRAEIEEYNAERRIGTVQGEVNSSYTFNRQTNVTSDGRQSAYADELGYGRKGEQVLPVGEATLERGRPRLDTEQSSFGGNENRSGTGTERLKEEAELSSDEKLKNSLGITELKKRNRSLLRQNKEFEKTIDRLQRQIRHPEMQHFVDFEKTKGVAKRLKTQYASTINVNEFATELGNLYDMMANDKQLNWDVVSTNVTDIAEKVIKASKNMNPQLSEHSKNVLRDIRSVGITLSDEQKQEVANVFGSYNEFRKATFGALSLRKNGVPLDTRWAELSDSYPSVFNREVSEADQGVLLFEAVKALKNTYNDDNGFDFESARDMLAAEIYEAYFEVPETKSLSSDYERKLTQAKIEYRKQLDEAKLEFKKANNQMLIAARKEYGKNLEKIRGKYDEQLLKNKARYEQRVQNIADTNARAQMRKNIVRRVKRLDVLVRRPNNSNNIPEGFQSAVLNLCEMFTNDTSVFDYERLDEVRKAYAAIRANNFSDETSISGSYDFDIENDLETLKKTIKGKRLAQLSSNQLEMIRDVIDHFNAVIKNETEIFVDGKKQYFENIGGQALREMKAKGIKKSRFGENGIKTTLTVNNLTPTYAFKDIGGTLETLFKDIRKGQDKYVENINPAKAFLERTMQKYNTKQWLKDEKNVLKLKTSRGETLTFTKEQALLVYATAKRERLSGQESKHLLTGGIVYENQIKKGEGKGKAWEYKTNDKNAHPLALDDIVKICDFLTPDQKSFADEIVNFLSTDMAELGNEVSMELYGIRKFKERYYIPFNSADSFSYRKFGESFDSRLKNMSMTKSTVRGAATPLVLSNFTEVVANHIVRMSEYNALVIPLENFTRVWNYKSPTTETEAGATVNSAFESAMGSDFKSYVEQFMKDVNGGVMSDKRDVLSDSLIRKFKKNAVFASMSVMIQQPSAVARAFALVDPKYFVKTTFAKRDYEELKKYAPVAVIKEIGGFDTTSGRNMVDWMLSEKPEGFKEKFKAFFSLKDSSYRDDVLSWGPGFADEITWAHIWNAVKAEVADKTGLSGEALRVEAGKRFAEVIDKTQVYDSVLSRSALMRSKNTGTQMATAFMAEPTLSYNMLLDGVKQAKRGNKRYGARVFAAFLTNTLFNSMLKSIITAARNDDDDKSQFEKYIAELVANFISDANPLSLMPIVKDVMSLLQGYDVSRADMSIFSDFVDSLTTITNSNKSLADKLTAMAGAVGGFIGVPAKNILRDLQSAVNTVNGLTSGNKTTAKGIEMAIKENNFQILKNLGLYSDPSKSQRLFEAWIDSDADTYNKVAKQFSSGQGVKNALVSQIKSEYLEGGFDESEAVSLLMKLDYSYDDSVKKLEKAKSAAEKPKDEAEEDENKKYKDFNSIS